MSDEQMKESIRAFVKAMAAGDSKGAASLLAPDAVWTGPGGVFKGAGQIVAYTERIKKAVADYKITENGMGIVVQGNTGVIEHSIAGVTDGKKWEVPATCIYEFKGDKIQNLRTFYDRLSQAQQVAGGLVAKTAVNSIVKAMEKPFK
jgi:uncharacterized protein (TIGR02246 family)